MAGFLDVLLRGLALCGQSLVIGGVLFALIVLRPAGMERPGLWHLLRRSRLLIALGAAGAATAQALSLTAQVSQLAPNTVARQGTGSQRLDQVARLRQAAGGGVAPD